METTYKQLRSGDFYKRKTIEISKDQLIKNVIKSYKKEDILNVLDHISDILRNTTTN